MIRSATSADEAKIRSLVFSVLESYCLKPSPDDTDADLYDLQAFYLNAGGDFSVLVDGEQIVGTVALRNQGDGSCELRKMYLDSAYRGRGLGKLLMEHALLKARTLQFKRITLETASVLKEALALYQQFGFQPYTPQHLAPRCDIALCLDL